MRPGGAATVLARLASVDGYLLRGAGRSPTLPTVRGLENATCRTDIQCARIGRVNQ